MQRKSRIFDLRYHHTINSNLELKAFKIHSYLIFKDQGSFLESRSERDRDLSKIWRQIGRKNRIIENRLRIQQSKRRYNG